MIFINEIYLKRTKNEGKIGECYKTYYSVVDCNRYSWLIRL